MPTTFGLKAAGWMAGLEDARRWLNEVREERLAAQLGGAAGTLASLGDAGPAVATAYAEALGLPEPVLPWHTLRGRIGELASALAVTSGAVAKAARDVILLSQTEVAEVREAKGGGSSAMPHKRNPVAAICAVACAQQAPGLAATLLGAMAHEHERAAGAWHAEWRPLGELLRSTGSAVAWLRESLEGLEVDPERMRANLDATGGRMLAERVKGEVAADDLERALAAEDFAAARGRSSSARSARPSCSTPPATSARRASSSTARWTSTTGRADGRGRAHAPRGAGRRARRPHAGQRVGVRASRSRTT